MHRDCFPQKAGFPLLWAQNTLERGARSPAVQTVLSPPRILEALSQMAAMQLWLAVTSKGCLLGKSQTETYPEEQKPSPELVRVSWPKYTHG